MSTQIRYKKLKHYNDPWHAHELTFSCYHIEANPVRSGFVEKPEGWKWSSAYARVNESDLIPDNFNIPVLLS